MRRDDGFTLIETLVALAVLATGAVALLGVVEDHTGRIAGLEDRVTLRWVAENRLAISGSRCSRPGMRSLAAGPR